MSSDSFKNYLETLRRAKFEADELLELLAPGHLMAEASLGIVWEAVFRYVCEASQSPDGLDLSLLNTLSGVLQKLMSSFSQLRTVENKVKDSVDGSTLGKKAGEVLKARPGISPDTLKEIEASLKFL